MITVRSEPTTANGIMLCGKLINFEIQEGMSEAYPDSLVELNLLFVVLLRVEGIQADVVVNQLFPNLRKIRSSGIVFSLGRNSRTLVLNASRSSRVKLSALAMTGTTLTTSLSFFMTMMSIGRRECPVGLMKNRQQWMRVS